MGPTETSHRRPQHQPWLPTPSPHAAAVAAAVASNLGSVERVAVGVPAAAKIPPAPTTSRPSARTEPPPPPAAEVTLARTLPAEEKPRPEAAETAGAAPPEEAEGKRKGSGGTTALAPGFRFHPTDEELVSYYLKRKVNNKPVRFNAIAEVDIYKVEPWELAEKSRLKTRDQEWYFFSALDRKYGNGARMNRATGKGYWKATGKDREVRRDTQLIAMKKTLVFHSGRAPGGQRTNWVMHEYRLQEEEYEKGRAMLPETFVLCRVFHKNNIGPPNGNRYAPFLEEEWDDGEATVVPGEDAVDDMVAAHETCAETNHVEPDSRSVNKDPASDNDLRKVPPNVLPVCKTEKVDDFAPLCVLNTEAPFPLLQYKRRKNNNDTGSNGSNSSDNSTWINQDPSSSSTTTATTDLMMTTNSATTTAVSALLEFSLMEPVERKESPYVSPHAFDSSRLDLSIPPSCMKFISDMQSEMQKIAVERDTLRLELMSAQAMINILQSRTDYMRKENEDLKRSLQDTK